MRLTKEDRYGHFYTNKASCRNIWSLDGKKLEGEFFENQTLAIDGEAIDKLGQLEDIEEELGIDLITLFKVWNAVLQKDFIWTKFEEKLDLTDDVKLGDEFNGLLFIYFYWSNGKHLTFELKDYGKTWALTKEELGG